MAGKQQEQEPGGAQADEPPAEVEQTTEQAVEQEVEQEVEKTPADEAVGGEPAPTPPPAVASGNWRDKRIETLTARLRKYERPGGEPIVQASPAAADSAELERLVEERAETRAQAIAAQQRFNEAADGVLTSGREAYLDFDSRVADLRKVVDWSSQSDQTAYFIMLQAAMDTGEAPKLIHLLGSDQDEAARILALPPARMGVELAKLAQAEAPIGAAPLPKPITPVTPRGPQHTSISASDPDRADKLSTAEWMKRREAEVSAGRTDNRRRA